MAPLTQCPPFPPAINPLSSCPWVMHISFLAPPYSILFKKDFYLFLERREGRKRERSTKVWMPLMHPPLRTCMCPDWELNWRPFGSQAGTQHSEPHQPGPYTVLDIPLSTLYLTNLYFFFFFSSMN